MWKSLATIPFVITLFLSHGQCATFIVQPTNVAVIEGRETQLNCQVRPNKVPPSWYVYSNDPSTSTSLSREPRRITHGYQKRFFLSQLEGLSRLFINMTSLSDSGVYFCLSGNDVSVNATLRVLSQKWVPRCTSSPGGKLAVGDELDIICLSRGESDTQLRWMRNTDVISGSSRIVNGTAVILHTSVVISDEAEVFICEASLRDLQATEICVLRPSKGLQGSSSFQYVAYVVVSFLSAVVVILFIVMIVVILRQRQCRYCQRQLPPPQTVLDMDQLQSGLGIIIPTRNGYDSDSIGSAYDLTNSSPPPDVVPDVYRRNPLGQKSPSSTLRNNMDLSDEEKPGTKTPTVHSPTRTRREMDNMDGRHFDSLQQQRDLGDISLDPNLPSTSNARTSTEVRSGNLSKKNQSSLNDLGTLQKERLYRKSKLSADYTKRKGASDRVAQGTSEGALHSDNISLNIKEEEEH